MSYTNGIKDRYGFSEGFNNNIQIQLISQLYSNHVRLENYYKVCVSQTFWWSDVKCDTVALERRLT